MKTVITFESGKQVELAPDELKELFSLLAGLCITGCSESENAGDPNQAVKTNENLRTLLKAVRDEENRRPLCPESYTGNR
jgi:hypothetical protein